MLQDAWQQPRIINMITFYGGQIKKEYRGEYSLVVADGKHEDYDIFLQPTDSDEFIHLTGVADVHEQNKRAYIGLSVGAGQEATRRLSGRKKSPAVFEELDEFLVLSHFLARARKNERQKCPYQERVCRGE